MTIETFGNEFVYVDGQIFDDFPNTWLHNVIDTQGLIKRRCQGNYKIKITVEKGIEEKVIEEKK